MRTTLDIDTDLLLAAKEMAAGKNMTTGAVVSELMRKAFASTASTSERVVMNGLRVVPPTGNVVTNKMVKDIREQGV
jgi:uncharacterized protein YnzC (UPF0291/DUF896 family)